MSSAVPLAYVLASNARAGPATLADPLIAAVKIDDVNLRKRPLSIKSNDLIWGITRVDGS
jgi:hypothetical protein